MTINSFIAASGDDNYQATNGNANNLTSTSLRSDTSNRVTALYFRGLWAIAGKTLTSAILSLYGFSGSNLTIDVEVYTENAAAPAVLGTGSNDISARSLSTHHVTFSTTLSSTGYTTLDITTAVQDAASIMTNGVVNVILSWNSGTTDVSAVDQSAAKAAKLDVTFPTVTDILVDNLSSKVTNGFQAGHTETWSHNIGNGATLLVVSAALWQDVAGSGTLSGVTCDGVAMTKAISGRTAAMQSEIWYIINPNVGIKNIVATVSGNTDACKFGSISLYQTHATVPLGVTGANNADTGDISQSVTSTVANSILIDSLSTFGTQAVTLGAGQTQIYKDSVGNIGGVASYKLTTTVGSYTMSYTMAGTNDDSLQVAEFVPAAAAPPPPTTVGSTLLLMGV